MDYKKKYKEALERAKKELDACGSQDCDAARQVFRLFPELKESEDENVRKGIISGMKSLQEKGKYTRFANIPMDKLLAWLEKQDKHLENYDEAEEEKADFVGDGFIECHADFLDFKEGNTYWLEYIGDDKYNVRSDNLLGKTYHITPCQLYTIFKKQTWLEKQGKLSEEIEYNPFDDFRNSDVEVDSNEDGLIAETIRYKKETQGEQKTANVKPKFKVGDYVVGKYISGYISEVRDDCYLLGYQGFTIYKQDNYHLWTIQDAKDGDILSDVTTIFIFKDLLSDGSVMSYCDYDTDSGESDAFCPISMNLMCSKITPSTKEQHDTLEKAMTEAGYEWDAEKKELKKIEKSTWSAEDDYNYGIIQYILNNECVGKTDKENAINWFNSLKDRVQLQHKEWSEEDDKMLNRLIGVLDGTNKEDYHEGWEDMFLPWLKSLKDKYTWKPSDEQMKTLKFTSGGNYVNLGVLESLYQDLKKLKEE